MATDLVLELREFLFDKVLYFYRDQDATDAQLTTLFTSIVSVDVSTKMALVPTAIEDNFASFNAAGQVKDSLKNADSFALAAHTHTGYLRSDASNDYNSLIYEFTWHATDVIPPFVVDNNIGGASAIVTSFNADYLDGSHASAFALSDHTHSEFVPWDAVTQIVSELVTFTPDTGTVPFVVGAAMVDVVTNLNADYLDGSHASAFALSDHTHSTYPLKAGIETISGLWTFDMLGGGTAPFAVAVTMSSVVTNLNADKLDGHDDTYFAVAAHTHAWGTITGTLSAQTDLQTALNLKMAKPIESAADGMILVWDTIGLTIKTTTTDLSDLATATQIALKYDKIAAVSGNIATFALSGVALADSGYIPTDFAVAAHTHNDIYFTETELTNSSTALGLLTLVVGAAAVKILNVGVAAADKIGMNVTTPDFLLDIGGDVRIEGTNKLYFGGTGVGDTTGNLYHDGTTFLFSDSVKTTDLELTAKLTLAATQAAGAQAGTIANVQTVGDPAVFFKMYIGATPYAVPGWAIP